MLTRQTCTASMGAFSQCASGPRRLELLGKHIRVNAFSEKVTVGLDSPLKDFSQIDTTLSGRRPSAPG